MKEQNMKRKALNLLGSNWGQRLTLLAIIIVVMAVVEPKFFSATNIMSILLAIAFYGIMACGMMFCVLVGGIDLSVGSMAALASTLFAMIINSMGAEPKFFFLGIFVGLLACVVVGLLHGVFDVYLNMPAFVVTYATQYALYGLTQEITKLSFIHFYDTTSLFYKLGNAKLAGVPMPVVFFLITALITSFVLRKTPFGRRLYAVGGNRKAAELVGIKTKMHIILSYVICSVAAGIAGMILVSMNMISSYTIARGYEGSVMMALVVGGMALEGGAGDVGGVIFGAMLVGIINNILILVGVDTDYNSFVQGIVIVLAVALNVYTGRKSQGLTDQKRRLFKKRQPAVTAQNTEN
jgi:ribose/xylose/arabinose/galactoside ABC-type transport system permease subunit